MTLVETQLDGRVRIITLNRPEKRNALNEQLMDELERAVHEADLADEARCILIAANGPDFCAGYDIAPTGDSDRVRALETNDVIGDRRRLRRNSRRWQALWELDTPTIAQVQGNCIAGGSELALMCDLVVAAEDARIGFPAVRALGAPPMNNYPFLFGPRIAKEMVLTGGMLTGRRAYDLGLVNRAEIATELHTAALRLAHEVAKIPSELLALNKAAINHACEIQGMRAGIELGYEMDALAHTLPAVKDWLRTSQTQGLASALRERDAPFEREN